MSEIAHKTGPRVKMPTEEIEGGAPEVRYEPMETRPLEMLVVIVNDRGQEVEAKWKRTRRFVYDKEKKEGRWNEYGYWVTSLGNQLPETYMPVGWRKI